MYYISKVCNLVGSVCDILFYKIKGINYFILLFIFLLLFYVVSGEIYNPAIFYQNFKPGGFHVSSCRITYSY